ncbi:MAG: hypothetical protein ABW217_09055 [Polyangiaceae bacterium]
MLDDKPAERVTVLRRKIAALETLAMDPGTSVPESESAQTTANKLRLELTKLVRDGVPDEVAAIARSTPPPPPPPIEPLNEAPPSVRAGNGEPWAATVHDTQPRRMPVWVKPAGPRWLRFAAPAVGLIALAAACWIGLSEPTHAPIVAQQASVVASPREVVPKPSELNRRRHEACKSAEDGVQALAAALLDKKQRGLTLTSGTIEGCQGRFESRVMTTKKGGHAGRARNIKAAASALGSQLCADTKIRAALVDHGASYTVAFFDQRGKWLEDATISAASCSAPQLD